MPDTKIKRNQNGNWIDLDDPTNEYSVRRQARNARAYRLNNSKFLKLTLVGNTDGTVDKLTAVQQRLFDRMTMFQNVKPSDAIDVILHSGLGYNQASSYGHMREAGATDMEAMIVVLRAKADYSVCYGMARARGLSHRDAVAEAEFNDHGSAHTS